MLLNWDPPVPRTHSLRSPPTPQRQDCLIWTRTHLFNFKVPIWFIFLECSDKIFQESFKIFNPSPINTVAFKIKTTTPKYYCVSPNVGVVPPKDYVTIKGIFSLLMIKSFVAAKKRQVPDHWTSAFSLRDAWIFGTRTSFYAIRK